MMKCKSSIPYEQIAEENDSSESEWKKTREDANGTNRRNKKLMKKIRGLDEKEEKLWNGMQDWIHVSSRT